MPRARREKPLTLRADAFIIEDTDHRVADEAGPLREAGRGEHTTSDETRQERFVERARQGTSRWRVDRMIVRNFNDPEVLETTYIAHRGAVARMVLTSEFTKAIEFLAYAILPPGNTIEEHTDPVEEIYLIFKGGGRMKVGDEQRDVVEGDAIWIPVGEPHALENTGDGEVFILVVAAYP